MTQRRKQEAGGCNELLSHTLLITLPLESNGATMRFKPECTDGANAGLNIMRDIVAPIKEKFPDVSRYLENVE